MNSGSVVSPGQDASGSRWPVRLSRLSLTQPRPKHEAGPAQPLTQIAQSDRETTQEVVNRPNKIFAATPAALYSPEIADSKSLHPS